MGELVDYSSTMNQLEDDEECISDGSVDVEDELANWHVLSEDVGNEVEERGYASDPCPSRSLTPKASVILTSNLFQNTKGRLYNAVRDTSKPIKFKTTVPVYVLGTSYMALDKGRNVNNAELTIHEPEFGLLMSMIYSQIWLTYRSGFTPLHNSNMKTDMGWGCMIRSLQMMIARGLLNIKAGRNVFPVNIDIYRDTLHHFVDVDKPHHMLSIHNIIKEAHYFGLKAGEWFDPSRACSVFKNLVCKSLDRGFSIAVFTDSCIHSDIILKQAKLDGQEHDIDFMPTIILLPTRIAEITIPEYMLSQLKFCLLNEHTLGFVGGFGNTASYFIGFQENEFIALDPHHVHPANETRKKVYHCKYPRKINADRIDPSIALGFIVTSENELELLVNQIETYNKDHSYPSNLLYTSNEIDNE